MEQFIEHTIDKGLESIAPGLYIFSIVFGIALVLLGVLVDMPCGYYATREKQEDNWVIRKR